MCSISGHWLGGLRGSWASRSPSLEADARAVLALITGRLRESALSLQTANSAGRQDGRW